MHKGYFRYLLHHYRAASIFFLVSSLIVAIAMNSGNLDGNPEYSAPLYSSSMMYSFVLMLVLTFILPVLLFSFVQKRNSSDLFLSLPVSRKQMLITTEVYAFILLSLMSVLAFVTGWIMTGMMASFTQILLLILASMFFLGVMLSVNTAFFLTADSTFDGIVMMLAYTVLPLVLAGALQAYCDATVAGYGNVSSLAAGNAIYVSPFMMSFGSIHALVNRITGSMILFSFEIMPAYYILCAVYGVLAWLALQRSFVKRQSERAGRISDSIMAYPFIIHAYFFLCTLMIFASPADKLLLLALLMIVYIAACFVYQRSFRFTKNMIILCTAFILASFLLVQLGMHTRGFGMADNYAIGGKGGIVYEYYSFRMDSYNGSGDVSFTASLSPEDIQKHPEVIEILEKQRKAMIDEFYESDVSLDDVSSWQGTLYVTNYEDNKDRVNFVNAGSPGVTQYAYHTAQGISMQDLVEINKAVNVQITGINGIQYDLDEYVKDHPEILN